MKVQCACHIAALRWSHSDLIGRSAVWSWKGTPGGHHPALMPGWNAFPIQSVGVIRNRDRALSLRLPVPTIVESACVPVTG